ncbi:DUF6660 family protein [Mucilaginibacter sp. BT774]|uniref:DUF6660 family protein n=1 Tax=Mucilaginibacter sp. BT774 TaxID=3062276 RepID=UPI00349FE5C4
MRYLALIFSVYFVLLVILPCQDKEDIKGNATHGTIKNANACNDQKSQETCPPFCTCSCCSTARILIAQVNFSSVTQITLRKYPRPTVPAVQKRILTIWQPPKIS